MDFSLVKKLMLTSRLHRQIINRVGLMVVLLAVLVIAGCISFMNWLYHKADSDEISAELTKVQLILQNEREGLGRAVRDYAVWNDAYDYIQLPQRKFESDNFTQQSLNVMQIDFVAIMTQPQHFFFSSALDPHNPNTQATPAINSPSLLSLLSQLPEWHAAGDGKPHTYITIHEGRALFLAVSGIFDSAQAKPQRGWMVFGRYMDDDDLKRLQQLAKIQLALSATMPTTKVASGFFHSTQTAQTRLAGWMVPTIWLQVSKEIDWQPRYIVMGAFALGLLLVLCVASWTLQYLLNKLVINRIETFADLAWRRSQGERVYWPVEGDNELDLLARTFNGLMDEVQTAQQNLQTLSVTDALTALGNRRGLEQEIELMIQASQPQADMSMLLMDLDGFKLINDSLGHAAGDLLLREVALRMRQVMRRQDQLFRMGGDEFTVLMPNTNVEQAARMAERLRQQLVDAIHFGPHLLNVSASIGIAQWDGESDGMELMRQADLAMYEAKRQGKSCISLYEKGMSGVASEQMQLEQALRQAIQKEEIEPYFQPVLDTQTGQVLAVEMLARWQWEDHFVQPADFIRLAEDLGLIQQLSAQLLDKGLKALTKFRQNVPNLKLQVNISPMQFSDRQLASSLLEQVSAHGLPCSALAIELTESAMLLYPEQVGQTMRQFVTAGVSLHLDDFGTGYSSLARLRDLPFDTVKLDRSFIVMMSEGDMSLPRVVFDMASSMNMSLIAEGVENQVEFERLKQIGYRQMQGFMFAVPMAEEALQHWLVAHQQQE